MKSVLASIKPKWCELIAEGKKTIEVRKTRPKCDTPFKVYIYATKAKDWLLCREEYCGIGLLHSTNKNYAKDNDIEILSGKVIGEFVCDKVETYTADNFLGSLDFNGNIITAPKKGDYHYWIPYNGRTCLSEADVKKYGAGKTLYGWRISDLKIYDEPKALSDFKTLCPYTFGCDECSYYDYTKSTCRGRQMKRPPQSWCYVEELK